MKHLIFSDIHSNLEALEAVLADADRASYDAIVCLGDFVGYGASPRECIERFRDLPNAVAVLGNHDAALLDPREREFFNPIARAGVEYSEQQVDEESLDFLRKLPLMVYPNDDFIAVHSSPSQPQAWVYVLEPIEAADAFFVMDRQLAFIGHTHFPAVHSDDATATSFLPGDRVILDDKQKRLINVGSVGQPRDGDARAAYVIYDDKSRVAQIHRVEYDVDVAADRILKAGLPPMLADRLRRGY